MDDIQPQIPYARLRGFAVPENSSNRPRPSRDSRSEKERLLSQLATILDLERLNPCRKPSWRWELAEGLSSSLTVEDISSLDPALARAVELRRASVEVFSDNLPADLTDLGVAFEITRMELRKWHLQARLLARETTEEIADRCPFSGATIDFFEQVFFNVRDRISARGWVSASVLEAAKNQSETAFKLAHFGYFGGPCVLEAVINDFADYPAVERDALRLKAELCTKLLVAPLDRDLIKLVNVCQDVRQFELMRARSEQTEHQICGHIIAEEVANTLQNLRRRPTETSCGTPRGIPPPFPPEVLAKLGARKVG